MGRLGNVSHRQTALRQSCRGVHLRHANHIGHPDFIVLHALTDTDGDAGSRRRFRSRLRGLGDYNPLLHLRVITLHHIYHEAFFFQKRRAFRLGFPCGVGNFHTLRSLRHREHNRSPLIYHQPVLHAGAKHRARVVRAVLLIFDFRREFQLEELAFRLIHVHADHADHLHLLRLLFLLLRRCLFAESKDAHRPTHDKDQNTADQQRRHHRKYGSDLLHLGIVVLLVVVPVLVVLILVGTYMIPVSDVFL